MRRCSWGVRGGTRRVPFWDTGRVKRVLLVLSQMPQDPASGAARSLRTMCELLGSSPDRFEVRAVACTGVEHAVPESAETLLSDAGITPAIEPASGARERVLRFVRHGVSYALLDTGVRALHLCDGATNRSFDDLLDAEARAFHPDIALTFGGQASETARRRRLRESGAAVVFGLRNHSYRVPGAFRDVDLVITPSRYLSDVYERYCGLQSVALPVPLNESEVLAPEREAVFFTFVNPSPEKGVMFFARLAEEVSRKRPDIGFMVVESRGTGGTLIRAGLAGGFDLRCRGNIVCSRGVAEPKHIYAATRVLLVPSVWEEPSGRVAGEAMLNGVPPIVSNRGGLPETVGEGGFILGLPDALTPASRVPVAAGQVGEWAALIERLADDEAFYADCCAKARSQGEALTPSALAPLYQGVFEGAARGSDGTLGPGVVG